MNDKKLDEVLVKLAGITEQIRSIEVKVDRMWAATRPLIDKVDKM